MTSASRLRQVAHRLHRGAVIAYPTEAVYGLGCDPANGAAVQRLLAIKGRPVSKGLILIAADFPQLLPYVEPLPAARMAAVFASWPGPVTWLLPASRHCPAWLTGRHASLAVRVTDHPLTARLCRAFGGPLVSTSANRSGRPPARNALQARLRCRGTDLVLHGPTGGRQRPSEIRDGRSGRTLRVG